MQQRMKPLAPHLNSWRRLDLSWQKAERFQTRSLQSFLLPFRRQRGRFRDRSGEGGRLARADRRALWRQL